jgi:outer membrane protein, multidrug efflux system
MNRLTLRAAAAAALCLNLIAVADAAAQTPGDVPVVTLDEARRRAQQVNPVAAAARAQVETGVWERRSALTDLFTPHLDAGVSYTRFSDPFFNFGTGNISPSATSATLQASYSLPGMGKIAELRRARASLESAESGENAAMYRTALATDAAYFAVLADRELTHVAQARLERAQEQFAMARVRVQAGEAIATDSLQLLLEVNRARLALLRTDSALSVSMLRLGRQIGMDGAAMAEPLDTTAPPPLQITQEKAVHELRTRGPEIEAARAAERRAHAALGVARAAYWPSLQVVATTGAYDAELFPSALKRTQVALAVSLPIWNGGSRELALAHARAERDVAAADRADRERAAAEAMARSYHGYNTARAAVELATVGVAVAAETYRVQGARYREGATTILDLLEAQVALGEAEAELVQSRHAARLAVSQIEMLLGRRITEDMR